jgi:hypothetical protein
MSKDEYKTEELVTLWHNWIRGKSINELVSRVDVTALGREIAKDKQTLERAYQLYDLLWDWTREELEEETRSVRELAGTELSERLVKVAGNTTPDEETARIMFRNPAAEAMFGNVLYEGISEFLSRVDIIGEILDNIPLIGGIKGKIEDNIPQGTQGLVEGRIKKFLGNFSGAACEKGMNVVLSDDHINEVQAVQAEVVEHFLDQPVQDYVPDPHESDEWKTAVWSAVETQLDDVEELMDRLDRFYDDFNAHSLDEFLPEELPKTACTLFASVIEEFLSDESVHQWMESYLEDTEPGS